MTYIACLGGEGTFSHQAASAYLPNLKPLYSKSLDRVIKQVNRHDYLGMVPFENSTTGLIRPIVDELLESDCHICGEFRLKIDHHLVSINCRRMEEIELIYVQREAHDQCKVFLKNFHGRIVLTQSSRDALLELENKKSKCAAITTKACIDKKKVFVIKEDVQSYSLNQTRFVLVKKGQLKTLNVGTNMMVFELNHTIGELSRLLSKIAALNCNILAIHSRPHPEKLGEFKFYMELTIKSEEIAKHLLLVFSEQCMNARILGSL